MKRKIRNLLLACSALALVGCATTTSGGGDSGKRVVKFEYLKGGFGNAPYEALANAYMAKHKDVSIKLVPNREINTTTDAKLLSGKNLSDIFSVRDINQIKRWVIKGYVEDLTDVYGEALEDGSTIGGSMDEIAKQYSAYNSHYYSVPEYYNINGFVYNASLFEQYGWQVPSNTKELKALCEKIRSDTNGSVAPLVYCGAAADGYLYFATDTWMDSYEGVSNMDTFYEYASPEVFNPANSLGKKCAMENLKAFFSDSSGYVMAKCKGKDHIAAQNNLIRGEAAMMLNGSWFENEMSSVLANYPELKLGMFRVPEISDDSGNPLHSSTYSTNEGKPIVDCTIGASYFIPKAAANKADAIDFLKFMCEATSNEIYTANSNAVRPFSYDRSSSASAYSGMSQFGKEVLSIADENVLYVPHGSNPLELDGYLSLYPQGRYWNMDLLAGAEPDDCLQSDYQYVLNNWEGWQKLVA